MRPLKPKSATERCFLAVNILFKNYTNKNNTKKNLKFGSLLNKNSSVVVLLIILPHFWLIKYLISRYFSQKLWPVKTFLCENWPTTCKRLLTPGLE